MSFRESTYSGFDNNHTDYHYTTSPANNSPAEGNLLLNSLPSEVKRSLGAALQPVVLRKEQYLYHEEDRLDFLYFPVTSVISEFRTLEDGRMVEISVTGKEGAIGLSSIFSGSPITSNCIQVSQAGAAHRVDARTFEKLIRSNDKIRIDLSHFIDRYIRQISQKAICNMYHSVKERLCTWLLMIQDRCGLKKLSLTHEQIARALGVYRPSITCIAQELRESRMIDYSRGGILIRDRKLIEQSACTCYSELCASPAW